jgi:hypothetical protein
MAFWKNREAVLGAVQRDWRALAQADVSLRGVKRETKMNLQI